MMGKLSVNELASKLTERKGMSKKQALTFVNEMFDVIQKGLEMDRSVKVKSFGTFKIISVDDRESINVNTGERVLIEGHSKITFTPDAVMKELVNKPFSQFETVVLNDGVDFTDVDNGTQNIQDETDEEEETSVPLVDFNEKEVPVVETPVEEPIHILTEPAPEPVVEEKTEMVEDKPQPEEKVEEGSSDEEIVYEDESSEVWKKWVLGVICCIVGFASGYYVGNMKHQSPVFPEHPQQEEITKSQSQITDSLSQEVVAEQEKRDEEGSEPMPEVKEVVKEEVKPTTSVVKQDVKQEPKSEPKKETKPEAKPATAGDLTDKYEKMDPRVFYGAYKIIGTDHVEKIRPTDNLARICKRTIGPGMECYLEVYNGIKGDADLKPGQDIKIPKLELKKKKKIKNKN